MQLKSCVVQKLLHRLMMVNNNEGDYCALRDKRKKGDVNGDHVAIFKFICFPLEYI